MKNYNCIVVLGPTASGKTRLACELASQLNGEVISLDSRQVYSKLNIGTGKDLEEYFANGKKIKYHLIDICDPEKQFYLHDFIAALKIAFHKVIANNKLPILCGGTGLYLDALRKDFSYTQIGEDHALREKLSLLSKEELQAKLKDFPAEFTVHLDLNSKKRLIRGIEVAKHLTEHPVQKQNPLEIYKPFYIGIQTNRDLTKDKIKNRLQSRLKNGMTEEVENLLKNGFSLIRLQQLGLEYKYISLYLENKISKTEMIQSLYTAICQFAKRQMTWFRKMEKEGVNIQWINPNIDVQDLVREIASL